MYGRRAYTTEPVEDACEEAGGCDEGGGCDIAEEDSGIGGRKEQKSQVPPT